MNEDSLSKDFWLGGVGVGSHVEDSIPRTGRHPGLNFN